jgi:hypothetical protein
MWRPSDENDLTRCKCEKVNQKILAREFVCDMWVPILKNRQKSQLPKKVVKFLASQIKFYHYNTEVIGTPQYVH